MHPVGDGQMPKMMKTTAHLVQSDERMEEKNCKPDKCNKHNTSLWELKA
jgi:hypothetical protein